VRTRTSRTVLSFLLSRSRGLEWISTNRTPKLSNEISFGANVSAGAAAALTKYEGRQKGLVYRLEGPVYATRGVAPPFASTFALNHLESHGCFQRTGEAPLTPIFFVPQSSPSRGSPASRHIGAPITSESCASNVLRARAKNKKHMESRHMRWMAPVLGRRGRQDGAL
jgi:hypothetical protein